MDQKQLNELLKNRLRFFINLAIFFIALSCAIKKGESEEVEFKKSTAQLEKGLKAVCGFLNHLGAHIFRI